MYYGQNNNAFDTSDVDPSVPTLDDVLNIAAEVLAEYGGVPGNTRIERFARFVSLNLGGEPYGKNTSGDYSSSDAIAIMPIGYSIFFRGDGSVDPDTAREIAVAFLRAAEAVES
jgi:hypothetical protein